MKATPDAGIQGGGNDSLVTELEERLSKLNLCESYEQQLLEFSGSSQNELRALLKTLGSHLQNESQQICLKDIHNALRKPLEKSVPISDNQASSILSYLKLLSEVAPSQGKQQVEQTQTDVFWVGVIEPIFRDILEFLNVQILKRSVETLSCPSSNNEETASATHHGTGYTFYQQLGILQKGIRILLVYMKRATSNISEVVKSGRKQEIDGVLVEMLHELCILLNPSGSSADIKVDFDVGLDIRCNIGVGLGYAMHFLKNDNATLKAFFQVIFKNECTRDDLSDIEKEIVGALSSDTNRIGAAFGILNTFLEHEPDSDLYFAICENVLNIQDGIKEAVNMGSSRVLEIWTEKLSKDSIPAAVLQTASSLFLSLESFSFMNMPGHIDAVKNCCRNIISSLSIIYHRLDEIKFYPDVGQGQQHTGHSWISNLLLTILDKPVHIKWIALACVAKNTEKALKTLEYEKDLPVKLLAAPRTAKAAANDTYIALMSYHFQSSPAALLWEKTWIDPLFTTLPTQIYETNWPQRRNIISAVLNSEKLKLPKLKVMIQPLLLSVVKRMTMDANSSSKDLENCNHEFAEASLLAAETIKMAHELQLSVKTEEINSISTTSKEDTFRGLVPRLILHSWLWSDNPQIRLAGLSLLVETKKTSEELSEHDFTSLKIFLKYNLHSQNAGFRQQFMSYFKKFVRRLKDGESVARRKKNEEVVLRYEKFLYWLWNFLTEDEGLFQGASFGRRCQALECLSELTLQFSDLKVFGVTDSGNLKYLRWFIDSYEYNKIHALQIFSRMPVKEFQDEQFCKELFNKAIALCRSVKPPDSVTGRYLMTLLMLKTKTSPFSNNYTAMSILKTLYSELEKIYKSVQSSSLIQVASENPMYGCIRCIRMILQNSSDYKQPGKISEEYREYVKNLLNLCFKIDIILFPVLGSAAPEGFLPGLKDSEPEENKQVVRSLTAQMLLVCAWRSMKEVCLLMADMCCWFHLEGETSPSSLSLPLEHLVTFQQVSDIGDHLLYLLKNLMHRGVFEQVYVGFKQLATRLWKSTSPSLSRLPEKWLQDAMDQEHISSKSITRRSAGLPFIFQGLLAAECDNEPFLQKWVQRLLIFDESPDMAPIRIHSMNVLRGLFRDASFSSAMMPFIPHGLKMAFRGLKSADWTERNSGLMLYGAVMRRSFGPKLNLMNAPTFFRKFPQMYDFLLGEMNICINRMEQKCKERKKSCKPSESEQEQESTCDFTFHLLLLLSSFTPSSRLEDSHFKLAAFIPRIRKCGESDDMEVRKLSAKALVPFLVSPEDKRDLMGKILQYAALCRDSQNQLHGSLCQILAIANCLSDEDFNESGDTIITEFLALCLPEPRDELFVAPAVFETIMNIIVTLNALGLSKKNESALTKILDIMLDKFKKRFGHIENRNIVSGLPVADNAVANTVLQILLDREDKAVFQENVYDHFTNAAPSSLPYTDEFLSLVQQDPRLTKRLFKEVDDSTVVLTEAVVSNYLRRIPSEFKQFPGTECELGYLKFMEAVPFQIYDEIEREIQCNLVERLFELCKETESKGKVEDIPTTFQIRASAFKVVGNIVFNSEMQLSQEQQEVLSDMTVKWSASDADDDMRLAVAECYPQIPFQNMKKFSDINLAKIWASVLMLAQDDDSSNRQIINMKLVDCGGKTVCDRRSLEVVVSAFLKEFAIVHPVEGILVLFGLLQRNDFEQEVNVADDESEDRLFDKSEMNMYLEHYILTKVIVGELRKFLSDGSCPLQKPIWSATLTSEQSAMYHLLANISPEGSAKLSLKSICMQVQPEGPVDVNKSLHSYNINLYLDQSATTSSQTANCARIMELLYS